MSTGGEAERGKRTGRASETNQVVTFTKAGRVPYLCTLHPTLMKGVVVVRR